MKISDFLGLFKQGKVGAKSHMKNLLEMAMVDGNFDDVEYDLLKKIAERHSINEKQLKDIKENMADVEFELPKDGIPKFSQFYDLVHMMVVDQYIDKEEIKLCNIFAKKFGYKEPKIDELVDAVAANIKNGQTMKDTYSRVDWLLI